MKRMAAGSLIGLCLILAQRAAAQGSETSMAPIMAQALPIVQELESTNYEIVRIEFDIVSSTKSTLRELQQGYHYGIVAFGDYRIANVNVAVSKYVDGQFAELQRDVRPGRRSRVDITPAQTGSYRIEVTAVSFEPGYTGGHYGLIVFHELK